MAVLSPRNRLVSFRLSEQEYEQLCSVSMAHGARSISDFARTALRSVLVAPTQPDDSANMRRVVDEVLSNLTESMEELSRVIGEVVQQIGKESSKESSKDKS